MSTRKKRHRRHPAIRFFEEQIGKIFFDLNLGGDAARRARLIIAAALSTVVLGVWMVSALLNRYGFEVPFMAAESGEGEMKPHETLMLADFESPESLGLWEHAAARMDIVPEHASEGQNALRVVFEGGVGISSVAIEDPFSTKKLPANWMDYDHLQFYVFNPNTTQERLIFQIKDSWDRVYKEDFFFSPGEEQLVIIPIRKIAAALNARRIRQMNLFRWEPKSTRTFYFDAFQLVPGEAQTFSHAGFKGVRPVQRLDYGFQYRKPAWVLQGPDASKLPAVRVPFIVANETGGLCLQCPVEGGIPFPMGELKNTSHLRLFTAEQQEVLFQPRVLSRWVDGSVKWLSPHFLASFLPGHSAGYFLDYGGDVVPVPNPAAANHLEDTADALKIDTGKIQAVFSKKKFYLFEKIFLDANENGRYEAAEEIVAEAPLILEFQGKEYRTDLDKKTYEIKIEERGPLRTVIKAAGWFQEPKGGRFSQVILRYYFSYGSSQVRVAHTLVYTGYPANKYYEPYQKLDLPANEMVESFGLRLPFRFSSDLPPAIQIGRQAPEIMNVSNVDTLRILQLGYQHAKMDPVIPDFPPMDFFGGWMDVSDEHSGVTVAVRHFRENYPKAISMDRKSGVIQLDLWPKEAGPLDLSTTAAALGPEDYARGNAFGLGKTHELLFYFHTGSGVKAQAADVGYSFMERTLVRNNPFWIDATGALGRLYPVDERYAGEEKVLERIFDWAARHPKISRWYGMLNFGDTLTWFRDSDDDRTYENPGWNPVGRWGWYNCEGVGTHTGALLQFARSGQWKYFEFGENLARHIMDVDTIHYDTIAQDPRLKKLDKIYSQVGSMHRHSADHWSGRSDEASHTSVVGLVLYYHLTGDERALDVIKEIGEFFLKEPFTYIGHPDIAPHRGMANALWGGVLLYELLGDERYKKLADKIIAVYSKGQQEDGSFLEDYNPKKGTWNGEKHYMYMEQYTLGAFIAYHELTQDERVKEMLLKTVNFLLTSEYSIPQMTHALAYAYLITQDTKYLAVAEKALQFLRQRQQSSKDPIWDGLIYEKPIYHRPMSFLSTLPYAFGALEQGFNEAGQGNT
jgi:hypothetical protein